MIARWRRNSVTQVESPDLARARRLVATQLLPHPTEQPQQLPPMPAWQAWGATLWMAITTGLYLAATLGLLPWARR